MVKTTIVFTFLVFLTLQYASKSLYAYIDVEKKIFQHSPEGIIKKLSSPSRIAVLNPDEVVKILNIKPNMHILDIGAGTGNFTFPIAQALEGSGKVYATEVEPAVLNQIKMKMNEFPYDNIMPVLVTTEGLDPFYKQYSFDIILLANVYNHLLNREIYFKELRPSLKKNGRLLIIHRKPIVDYNNVLSTHLNKITEKLYSEGENFPLYHRLSKMVQNLLKDEPIVESLSEDTRNAMIRDIQTSFLDRYLFNDFYNYYRNKENKRLYLVLLERHSRHISLIQWLANQLHEKGVFNPLEDDRVILTDSDKRNLHKLNSLLISDILEIPELILDWPLILIIDKDHVISTMDTAGYQFLRSYDIFPEFYLLEFEGKN